MRSVVKKLMQIRVKLSIHNCALMESFSCLVGEFLGLFEFLSYDMVKNHVTLLSIQPRWSWWSAHEIKRAHKSSTLFFGWRGFVRPITMWTRRMARSLHSRVPLHWLDYQETWTVVNNWMLNYYSRCIKTSTCKLYFVFNGWFEASVMYECVNPALCWPFVFSCPIQSLWYEFSWKSMLCICDFFHAIIYIIIILVNNNYSRESHHTWYKRREKSEF